MTEFRITSEDLCQFYLLLLNQRTLEFFLLHKLFTSITAPSPTISVWRLVNSSLCSPLLLAVFLLMHWRVDAGLHSTLPCLLCTAYLPSGSVEALFCSSMFFSLMSLLALVSSKHWSQLCSFSHSFQCPVLYNVLLLYKSRACETVSGWKDSSDCPQFVPNMSLL